MRVDTSVWIDFFNGYESKHAECLTRAIAEAEPIFIPGLVLTEILLGLKNDAEAKRIRECRSRGCAYRGCKVCHRIFLPQW